MADSKQIDIGFVDNLAIMRKPGAEDKYLFIGQSASQGRWVKIITQGAAQTLWFHLTHILYPRAADQITPRAATAMLSNVDDPNITTTFAVQHIKSEESIELRGMSMGGNSWRIRFKTEDGYNLWASLEDLLDAV